MGVMGKYFNFNVKGTGKIPVFPIVLVLSQVVRLISSHFFLPVNPIMQNTITLIQFLIITAYGIAWFRIYLRAVKKNKAELEN